MRLHHRKLEQGESAMIAGLPVTRPSRIASDLLHEREDPEAVARVVADAIRGVLDYPGTFAEKLAPHAARFGLRRGDGIAMLRWLLDLAGDPETQGWMQEARASASTTTTISSTKKSRSKSNADDHDSRDDDDDDDDEEDDPENPQPEEHRRDEPA